MLTLDENYAKLLEGCTPRPWEVAPYRLVSWWDVERFAADHFCALAAWIENRAAWYRSVARESPGANPTWNQRQALQRNLDDLALRCKAIGLRGSADSITEFRNSLSSKRGPTYERVGWHLGEIAKGIEREMRRALFLYVPQQRATFYTEPLKGWEPVLQRFKKATEDIEEALKCFALDRYGGAVFHMMLVAERGALEIANFIGTDDAKPGWRTATLALERITQRTEYRKLPTKEQQYFGLFEQVLPLMLSMQRAWRDKISHADNRLMLLSGDFQAYVAEEIISATRAFMRRLAEDLPHEFLHGIPQGKA